MSMRIGHLRLVEPVQGPAPTSADSPSEVAAGPAAAASPAQADVIPSSPPPEVSDEVDLAALRAQQLHEADRELHFAKDPHSGRVVVQVRDLDGSVVRTIPPSEALDIMSGLGEP